MMAIPKSFMLLFLVLCSWVFVGFCQGPGDNLPCVQKLMPCQPYLKVESPPASCCVPLKQLVADDKACLCTVLNNPAILQSLNITKADAVNLAKNCGSNTDLSTCNNIVTPSPGSNPSNGTTPSPPPKSAASVASFHVETYLSLLVVVLIFTISTT
ncbi:non-specific lipid transfer protein GPI-anchored 9-like [Primulina huaijiensis]|uniref:non-specific lipid transfer protein GPI-anchored 9-like n=1 Tax=Primulina huaijiensis TaxID=1492673 RepID=UPI003CC731D9